MKIRLLLIFFTAQLVLLAGCASEFPPLETVRSVDLSRYIGKWYEIASFPNRFQKGCNCTTAEYKIEDDFVRVVNRCRKDSVNGEIAEAVGKAFAVDGANNSKLKVQFFWPFKGDYWVIDLAEDYSYAVVGDPSRKYLWVLYRKPEMDKKLYSDIIQRAAAKGFDISKLRLTAQNCD